ncbi:RBR-type E3 ubiquitin transferase [Mycena chlorophos]|uniref:RBR-type E3 ubiquitin transferase n=1 Tax=Mycena chlorophos TaxID=658473 RepID=A0A8H6TIX5_MYCCL|nr:RBR-type E3 ubiquitin transferase [Mycena chlorophos]
MVRSHTSRPFYRPSRLRPHAPRLWVSRLHAMLTELCTRGTFCTGSNSQSVYDLKRLWLMKTALEALDQCRVTLKGYLAKGNKRQFSEDNQEPSELIESALDPKTIPVLHQKVANKMVSQ